MTCFTETQVREHSSSSSCWIIYKGRVYDITDFLQDHPGGRDILLGFAGTDVTHVLGDENLHMHSDAAYELLDEYYYIGDLEACTTPELVSGSVSSTSPSVNGLSDQDDDLTPLNTIKKDTDRLLCDHVSTATDSNHEKFLDLRKPLFPQLWNATWSKEFYLEQVHHPRFVPYYVPYFSNPWMDVLSRTTWYTVPMIWIPFVFYQLWKSLQTQDSSMTTTFNTFCSGVLAWTLLEYGLHRFLFHLDDWLPDRPLALLFHFTLHGIHHHMPMDRLRLVMPPALTTVIGYPIIMLAHHLLQTTIAHAFIAGAFFGYVCYDMTHYYIHHAQVIRIHFHEMKRYHLAHHYKNYQSGYGITSKLWDYVFNTVLVITK